MKVSGSRVSSAEESTKNDTTEGAIVSAAQPAS